MPVNQSMILNLKFSLLALLAPIHDIIKKKKSSSFMDSDTVHHFHQKEAEFGFLFARMRGFEPLNV